jgi:hypothetical protein
MSYPLHLKINAKDPAEVALRLEPGQRIVRCDAYPGWRWRFEGNVAIHEIDPDHTPLRFWKEPLPCP